MPNPATVSDIEARWRPLTAQETTNATAFLDDAWELLISRRPNLETHVADGDVSEANVVRVVAWMVRRVLMNPEAWEDEAIDDWRGRRNALVAAGILTVTPDELADVTPGRARRRSVRLVAYNDDD
jgi:hypothetical protein